MISREIEKELEHFYTSNDRKALLITGARQVGKAFIIRNNFAIFKFKQIVVHIFLPDLCEDNEDI